ncbi:MULTISPECIES: tannase/feruloyl esterase family alpha/beta hydrolase [unclassified Variovorax]|uniref:tannase/feruloyl esterase family alpha/beta hydrolase n=1 Tax=unclassified Variovorax TaxID=663243 RepID=UPI0008B7D2F7|nr:MULTISPECIES: tannase/feruloyl esterase family alpha/beta hydrolase [unclassified Variovorax]SEK15773.1 Tannase and feruloyl esterase [Variovorax sp. OK202]SFE21341.1 Tannase and feruloyl esterase [Variovorax sp. OK212]
MAIQEFHAHGPALGAVVLASAMLAGCAGTSGTSGTSGTTGATADAQAACTALQGMEIPASAIGQAPETIASVDNNPDVHRSRTMCRWPAWPMFTGAAGASVNDASNFGCVVRRP